MNGLSNANKAVEPGYRKRSVIDKKATLRELALFFLRLGTTAFGGPAAHIAIMEDEVVQHRQWVPQEKRLEGIGEGMIA